MRVAIAGGHGQIALIIERLLSEAGHEAIGIIRNPEHAADLLVAGGLPLQPWAAELKRRRGPGSRALAAQAPVPR